MKALFKPLVLGLAVSAVAAGAALGSAAKNPVMGTRAAAPAPGKSVPAGSAVTTGKPKPPKGYVVVSNGPFTANAGVQTRGTVACPAGLVPFSGGAFISSSSTAANINSSFPSASGWIADANNATASATTFNVYAVCAFAPKKYHQVVSAPVTSFAGTQTTASSVCPAGQFVVGGGGLSSSSSTAVNMNSTVPSGNAWRTDENNASANTATITTYAICVKKPAGYIAVVGSAVTNPAGAQTLAGVTCPAPTVPVGGGGFSSTGSTAVNLNSSLPQATGWLVYEDNASAGATTITAYEICAGR